MEKIISIDIGGTNTRVALMQDKKILKIEKFSTNNIFEDEVEKIKNVIIKIGTSFEGISISAPGPADYKRGIFGDLPNLPWENKNIIQSLKQEFSNIEIKVENDANLMALAHHFYFKNNGGVTQFFTVSTGLGAGLIIDDKIFSGANGVAQEVANMPSAFSKEKGKQLGQGSLEYFASGSGISVRANMSTKDAMNLYGKDKRITKIINEGIDALANAIASCVAIINHSLFVFDGSVSRHNQWYIKKAWQKASERSFAVQFKNLRFEFANLNDDAALIGAYINMLK